MSSQREMSGDFPVLEDILRFASAEGSFGAGELNTQKDRSFCSKFSRNSSVMGERCVHSNFRCT